MCLLSSYKDNEPCFDLCVNAQRYYEINGYTTRVKVAGLLTIDQAVRLAGSSSMTVAPALLQELSETQRSEAEAVSQSLFLKPGIAQEHKLEHRAFIDDEKTYREAFANSNDGKGAMKTTKV